MTSYELAAHLHDVDQILLLGGTVPAEHHDIRARWHEFLQVEMHGMEHLRSAVIEGNGKLEAAYCDAVTENAADGQMRVIIQQNIARDVLAAMRDHYATTTRPPPQATMQRQRSGTTPQPSASRTLWPLWTRTPRSPR